jgi:hypothetical protein
METQVTTVDQQTRRRNMRTGLTALDPDLACPGYVPYNPNGASDLIHLIDLDGREVHQWTIPFPPRDGYLLPKGNPFVLVKEGDQTDPKFPSWGRAPQD